jgi:uncharacterized protein YggT (Ycf19 family)
LPVSLILIQALLRLLQVMQLFLIIRAVMSWIPLFSGATPGVFSKVIVSITEPLLYPARVFLSKSNFAEQIPIDLSFLVTYFALQILRRIIMSFLVVM